MKNTDNQAIGQWAALWMNMEQAELKSNSLDNDANESFSGYKYTLKILDVMQEIEQFDTDKAWKKVLNTINSDNQKNTIQNGNKFIKPAKFWLVAASVAFILGISVFMLWSRNNTMQYAINESNTVKVVKLPDGSSVYLNTNAQLSYKIQHFNTKTRTVMLSGEAFFEVEPNPQKPFIVESGKAIIKVLGTSFNVKNSETKVEIAVQTGKVGVFANSALNHDVMLVAGDAAVVMDNGTIEKSMNTNDNFISWLNHKLVFKAQPLAQVIMDIENTYHCKIELADSLSSVQKITTTFNNASIDDVITSISVAFNLKVERSGNNYKLIPIN